MKIYENQVEFNVVIKPRHLTRIYHSFLLQDKDGNKIFQGKPPSEEEMKSIIKNLSN
jgi:hypothetical protein